MLVTQLRGLIPALLLLVVVVPAVLQTSFHMICSHLFKRKGGKDDSNDDDEINENKKEDGGKKKASNKKHGKYYQSEKSFVEVVKGSGYVAVPHHVITEDGFVLTVFRITKHGEGVESVKKPVVLLQHGLLQSAAVFIPYPHEPENSLAFHLVEQGCDVWLGNNRGTCFGRRHQKYSTSQSEFWAWSQDEFARYDLPGMVDYICNATGSSQIAYLGHSQGTTQCFAGLSSNPHLNKKISLFVAMAPAAYVNSFSSPALTWFANLATKVQTLLLGHGQFIPIMDPVQYLAPGWFYSLMAYSMIYSLFGWSDTRWIPGLKNKNFMFAFCPAGTSARNIIHWFQTVTSKEFKKFVPASHGEDEKREHYNLAMINNHPVDCTKPTSELNTKIALI